MKISFRARFRTAEWKEFRGCEVELNDVFLIFLPNKIEIIPVKATGYGTGARFDVKMVTKKLFTLEDIKEKLHAVGINITNISHVKREFTDEELEQVKTLVCFREIFSPTEGEVKKQ